MYVYSCSLLPVRKRTVYTVTRVYSCCTLELISCVHSFFFEGRKRVIVMESMVAGKLNLVRNEAQRWLDHGGGHLLGHSVVKMTPPSSSVTMAW